MEYQYRIVKHIDDRSEPYFCVHEVLVEDDGTIVDMSDSGIFSANTPKELAHEIGRIIAALTEPVIDESEKNNESAKRSSN